MSVNVNASQDRAAAELADEMAPQHLLPAWLLSFLLHGTVLLALGATVRFAPRAPLVEPDRSAGIVLARREDDRREYFDGQRDAAASSQKSASSAAHHEAFLPDPGDHQVDFTGVLPAQDEALGGATGNAVPSAAELTSDRTGPAKIGGKVQTSVFGVSGIGTKFVYVFDRSGSMAGFGGRPLSAAQAELIASLQDLDRIHQFQIIFYNERPRVFNPTGGTPRLVWGDAAGKDQAVSFVKQIVASGGTRHLDALKMALAMRPDVLFFLTDADEPRLTADDLARIRSWNYGTMINAIEFGFGASRGGDNFLIRLARQNGGQHAYVDIARLPRNR